MPKFRILTMVWCIMLAAFFTGTVYAATFHVTSSQELKLVLSLTSSNLQDDLIYLAAGTYSGGFIYYADENEHSAPTIKAEQGLSPSDVVLDGGNSERVFLFTDVYNNSDCTIEGITVQNGTGWFSGGLGISTGGNITVKDCIIRNNSSTSGGGVFASTAAKITIENNTITSNTASNGGGIYPLGGEVLITGNEITGNVAGGDGGAMRVAGYPITIEKNVLTANTSTRGGGVYAFQAGEGMISLTANSITGNGATYGGACI